jgi:hypothetical protein
MAKKNPKKSNQPVITAKPIRAKRAEKKALIWKSSKYLLWWRKNEKGTLSPFNGHLHRRRESGGWGSSLLSCRRY